MIDFAIAEPLEEIERYCEGVESGAILAGLHVRNAVKRHIRDLERQRTQEFPYYFDEQEAEDACLFFPVAFRHYKSKWAGQPFNLSPWQMFVNGSLLGWRHMETGFRRFKRAFVSVARKQGKTSWCGGLAVYLALADGEAGAEVYIGATKIDQARILFTDSEKMLRKSPHLMKRAKILKDNIAFPEVNSFIRPLGSDKPFDGLNPHGVLLDELHAFGEHHRPFYDTMRTGSGARPQPIICTITTAGSDKSYIWKEEEKYATGVVAGTVEDETLFAFVASIDEDDDPLDPDCWIKANPNLGVSVSEEYLQDMAKEARESAAALNRFKRYHCNIMVSSNERAISPELWQSTEAELSDWSEADAVAAGFDLGGRDDLASYALCARFHVGDTDEDQPIYRYEVRQRSYIAEDTKRDLSQAPFASFIAQGLLTVCRHHVQQLRDDLVADCEELGVEFIAHDPYQAMQLAADLEEEGLKPVKMPQNYSQFNEPIRSMLRDLQEGRFHHDSDPLLAWCATNAMVVQDRQERWMFDKATSTEKIDPLVAVTMAYRAAGVAPSAFKGEAFII